MKCGECQYAERVCSGAYRCKPAYLDKLNVVRDTKPWLSTSEAAEYVEGDPKNYHSECDRPKKDAVKETVEGKFKFKVGDTVKLYHPKNDAHGLSGIIVSKSLMFEGLFYIKWDGYPALDLRRPCCNMGFFSKDDWEKREAERVGKEEAREGEEEKEETVLRVGDRVRWWEPKNKTLHGTRGVITDEPTAQRLVGYYGIEWDATPNSLSQTTRSIVLADWAPYGILLEEEWDKKEKERLSRVPRLGVGTRVKLWWPEAEGHGLSGCVTEIADGALCYEVEWGGERSYLVHADTNTVTGNGILAVSDWEEREAERVGKEEETVLDQDGAPIRIGDRFRLWWSGGCEKHAEDVTVVGADKVTEKVRYRWRDGSGGERSAADFGGSEPREGQFIRPDRWEDTYRQFEERLREACRADWGKLEAERQKAEKSEE